MPTNPDLPLDFLIAINSVVSTIAILTLLGMAISLFPQIKRALLAYELLANDFSQNLRPTLVELKLLFSDLRRLENSAENKLTSMTGTIDSVTNGVHNTSENLKHKTEVVATGILAGVESFLERQR